MSTSRPALAAVPLTVGAGRRWSILVVSFLAQAASTIAAQGTVFLIPALHAPRGLSLAEAGLVTAAPMARDDDDAVRWGMVVDRCGERLALLGGLGGTALFTSLGALSGSIEALGLALFLAGASAASCNVAGGTWWSVGFRLIAAGLPSASGRWRNPSAWVLRRLASR